MVALALLNLGPTELVLILLLLVLLFGAQKVPELARSLGRARGQMERAKREVEDSLRGEEERALAEQLKFEAARETHMRQQNAEFEALRRAATELGIDASKFTTPEGLQEAIRSKVAPQE